MTRRRRRSCRQQHRSRRGRGAGGSAEGEHGGHVVGLERCASKLQRGGLRGTVAPRYTPPCADNTIGPAGAVAIARALRLNRSVSEVFLSGEWGAGGRGAGGVSRQCALCGAATWQQQQQPRGARAYVAAEYSTALPRQWHRPRGSVVYRGGAAREHGGCSHGPVRCGARVVHGGRMRDVSRTRCVCWHPRQ